MISSNRETRNMSTYNKDMYYTCDRCHGRLRPGDRACLHCWKKFTSPVPLDASHYSGVSQKLPPRKQSWVLNNITTMIVLTPFLLFFDLTCFSVSRMISDNALISDSQMHLSRLAEATKAYEADHGNRFPPTDTTGHFQAALAPYISLYSLQDEKLPEMFEQPQAGPYRLNKSISGSVITPNTNLSEVVIAEETMAHNREGGRMQLFADGHIRWSYPSVSHH